MSFGWMDAIDWVTVARISGIALAMLETGRLPWLRSIRVLNHRSGENISLRAC